MRIHLYLLLLIVTFKCSVSAQAPFTRFYGSMSNQDGKSMIQTKDGGFLVIGSLKEPPAHQTTVAKLDSTGDTIWVKSYDYCTLSVFYDRLLLQDPDGGFIIPGTSSDKKFLVVKSDPAGDTIWTSHFEQGGASSVILTNDNSLVALGGCKDGVKLIKLTRDGQFIWSKQYRILPPAYVGSYSPYGIKEIPGGGFLIFGEIISSYMYSSIFLLRVNPSGDSLYYHHYNIGSFYSTPAYSMDTTADHNFILCGLCTNTNSIYYGFLFKVDQQGDSLWAKISSDTTMYFSVATLKNGHYIVCGGYQDTTKYTSFDRVFYAEFDADGNRLKEWKNHDRGFGAPNCIIQTRDNGYAMCGNTVKGFSDSVYVIKTDPQGWMEGVDEKQSSGKALNLECFPNPASEIVFVSYDGSGSEKAVLQVLDATGRIVIKQEMPSTIGVKRLSIDARDLPEGLYLVSLISGNRLQTRKLLIKH
jgi:hypothetical protein